MKKMIYLLSCLLMVFTLTNCTSNNTDESGDEVASEESFGEESSEEVSSEDGEAVAEDSGAVTEEGGDEGFGEESLPTEEVAETATPAEGSDPSLDQPADATTADASTEIQPTESIDNAGVDLGTPPDAMADGTADPATETAMTEAPTPELQSSESTDTASTDSFAAAPSENFSNEEAPKPVASLKKIELAPFNRAGQLLNAVYVARPGDDFTTISQMIYGSPDKAENLKQANAWITTLRAGDKVYYNSPMRPTDSTKLLTFYEEQGVPSEVYTVGAGEDLKAVSAKLLGYPNAWKEVWATNLDIESKGELSEGTQLRYWKNAGNFAAQAPAPTAEVAANMPPPPMPEEFAQTEMPPPPPMDAMNPPPPMPEEFAQADMPPPPPMMDEASLPPPPQQPAPAAVASMDEEQAGMDNDMMMNLGGAAIAAAALGAFVMIRRKKSREKEISQAFDSTQVG